MSKIKDPSSSFPLTGDSLKKVFSKEIELLLASTIVV